ncbi:hypothetical protein MKX08_005920 [Trichoderma sp. CBMAI-0020]|nr:hypothetical protein MKX08_005920 [Trichoderma sp. CBMAI-0020]
MEGPKLFITGATGYIGGSVLSKIVETHPEFQITALMRNATSDFTARYPNVSVVQGTFDDFEVIETAAQDAEIVIRKPLTLLFWPRPLIEHPDTGDIDHPGCAKAILSGLAKKTSKSFLIHLTGTACISDMNEQTWEGKVNQRIWDDVQDIDEIYNLPETAWHHAIDQWIADASNDKVKTLTICPPDLYGQSTTVGGRTTYLVPEYVAAILKYKEAFYLGEGQNVRAVTHIDDLTELFVLVLEKYLEGGHDLHYGREGFYFATADEVAWKPTAEAINKIGQEQGWLPAGTRTVSWTKEQLAAQGQVDKGQEARMEAAWA